MNAIDYSGIALCYLRIFKNTRSLFEDYSVQLCHTSDSRVFLKYESSRRKSLTFPLENIVLILTSHSCSTASKRVHSLKLRQPPSGAFVYISRWRNHVMFLTVTMTPQQHVGCLIIERRPKGVLARNS